MWESLGDSQGPTVKKYKCETTTVHKKKKNVESLTDDGKKIRKQQSSASLIPGITCTVTQRYYILEDLKLQNHCCENFKSYSQ